MASDIFLDLSGLSGECEDMGHSNWIELTSFSFNVMRQTQDDLVSSGEKDKSTRPQLGNISLSKKVDKTSPKLASAACSGTRYTAEIEFCQADSTQKVFLSYKLKKAHIVSYTLSGGSGFPTESFSLAYEEISWNHPGSGMKGGWNVPDNKESS